MTESVALVISLASHRTKRSMSSSFVRVIKNVSAIIIASPLSDCDLSSQMERTDPNRPSLIVSRIISKRDFKIELGWTWIG